MPVTSINFDNISNMLKHFSKKRKMPDANEEDSQVMLL